MTRTVLSLIISAKRPILDAWQGSGDASDYGITYFDTGLFIYVYMYLFASVKKSLKFTVLFKEIPQLKKKTHVNPNRKSLDNRWQE